MDKPPEHHRSGRLIVEPVLRGLSERVEPHHVPLYRKLRIFLLRDEQHSPAELEITLGLLYGLGQETSCGSGFSAHSQIYRVSRLCAPAYISRIRAADRMARTDSAAALITT